MFNFLANLNPNDLLSALEELRKSAEQIKCINDRLSAMQRMFEYEFGAPVRDLPAHDPRKLPLIVQVSSGRLEIAAALGKPATRGHIANIGDNPAHLFFESKGKRAGPYTLLTGTALDISFAVEVLDVQDDASGPTVVQVFAQ